MSAIADRYRKHADVFERKVAAVRSEQWLWQSPCEAWTARDVVDHVVAMHGHMLQPLGRALSMAPTVKDDPLGAFRAARADIEAVLDDPELARVECDTPAGRMTVDQQIDEVVSDDMVLHAWDLARATGQDDAIDPEDVERLWSITTAIPAELMEKYRTPGAFGAGVEVYGPEVPVSQDASLQDRLLGLVGRDPGWSDPPAAAATTSGCATGPGGVRPLAADCAEQPRGSPTRTRAPTRAPPSGVDRHEAHGGAREAAGGTAGGSGHGAQLRGRA